MRIKILIGTLLIGGLAASTLMAVAPAKKAAAVYLPRPTIVAGAIVQGSLVFEHDDERMARGEPCTSVYRFDTKHKRSGELIVEFMCRPVERSLSTKFEVTCSRGGVAGPDRMVEYQFPGDREGHGVPYSF